MQKFSSCFTAALLLAASGVAANASSVNIYLSSPFTQTAQTSGAPDANGNYAAGYTNAVSETFDGSGVTTGTTYTTFTSTGLSYNTDTSPATATPAPNQAKFSTSAGNFSIIANGEYGGGGQGNYLGVNNGGTTTLQLSAPVGYLGLEWCAVDNGNSLTLYDQNNNAIGTFNAGSFTSFLGGQTNVTALNGTSYPTANYKGQPTGTSTTNPTNGRQDATEYFAYVDFIANSGTKISKIVLSESSGSTFESDNYAILTTAPAAQGSFVYLTSVPEPSTWAFFAAAGGALVFTVLRRRAS